LAAAGQPATAARGVLMADESACAAV